MCIWRLNFRILRLLNYLIRVIIWLMIKTFLKILLILNIIDLTVEINQEKDQNLQINKRIV
jgi:hypothetical protein